MATAKEDEYERIRIECDELKAKVDEIASILNVPSHDIVRASKRMAEHNDCAYTEIIRVQGENREVLNEIDNHINPYAVKFEEIEREIAQLTKELEKYRAQEQAAQK